MDQRRALDQIREWATEDANIRLVVVTGSLARGGDAADELSDLDIELYVREPKLLLENRGWYQQFGQVLVVEELENSNWHPSRLIYYIGGKIDFMVAGEAAVRQGVAYDRPFDVLVDKDELRKRLTRTTESAPLPTAQDFARCINWFYAAALMYAKCLVRQEPWMAKFRDWDLKLRLLEMITWDHKCRHGWDYDTWHNGVHARDWMDDDVFRAVGGCWADFSIERMERALLASIALFERLSQRTATVLAFEPFDSRLVQREIDRLLKLPRGAM